MTVGLFITLFLIGFIGSFLSGLVGIGGSIIKYPMLLYLPAAFGVASFTAHEVSGISALEVLFASAAGVIALRKEKVIHYRLVAYMGTSIIIGSFIGAYGGRFLAGSSINVVYGILAALAAVLMILPKSGLEEKPLDQVDFHRPLAILFALVVGIASGVVGAGGAFLLVPIMLVVLKIPTRVTIASSLAITFLSSLGSATGKLLTGDVLIGPAMIMIIASVIAAPLGAILSKRVNPKLLQTFLAVLIMSTAIKIGYDLLFG